MHNWERSAGLWTPVSPLGQPDSRYIRVETCMFMVKLPQYTSLDVMLEKLRYAIHYREDPLSGWEDLTTEYSPLCAPNLALTRDPFSPFIPKFLDFPLRQTLCSAALTSHKVNFITFSVAMLCLSLLYIAVYTNCTFHYFDLFCFFFSSCYCILFFFIFFFKGIQGRYSELALTRSLRTTLKWTNCETFCSPFPPLSFNRRINKVQSNSVNLAALRANFEISTLNLIEFTIA